MNISLDKRFNEDTIPTYDILPKIKNDLKTNAFNLDSLKNSEAFVNGVFNVPIDNNHNNLLHYILDRDVSDATEQTRFKLCEFLIESGIDTETPNIMNETPLHIAVKNHYPSIVKLLINSGVNVNYKNSVGTTPLHYATRGLSDSVEQIDDRDLNVVNENEKDLLFIKSVIDKIFEHFTNTNDTNVYVLFDKFKSMLSDGDTFKSDKEIKKELSRIEDSLTKRNLDFDSKKEGSVAQVHNVIFNEFYDNSIANRFAINKVNVNDDVFNHDTVSELKGKFKKNKSQFFKYELNNTLDQLCDSIKYEEFVLSSVQKESIDKLSNYHSGYKDNYNVEIDNITLKYKTLQSFFVSVVLLDKRNYDI